MINLIFLNNITNMFVGVYMKGSNFDYNEEIKKCKTIDDVMDKNGLI